MMNPRTFIQLRYVYHQHLFEYAAQNSYYIFVGSLSTLHHVCFFTHFKLQIKTRRLFLLMYKKKCILLQHSITSCQNTLVESQWYFIVRYLNECTYPLFKLSYTNTNLQQREKKCFIATRCHTPCCPHIYFLSVQTATTTHRMCVHTVNVLLLQHMM